MRAPAGYHARIDHDGGAGIKGVHVEPSGNCRLGLWVERVRRYGVWGGEGIVMSVIMEGKERKGCGQ